MTEQEGKECVALDLAWMDIERQADVLIALARQDAPLHDSRDFDTLLRGMCSLVGLECKRRQRERKEATQ